MMLNEQRVGFIIKARMSSSRLPGKALKKICGITCLEHLVRRLVRSKYCQELIIATSTQADDDVIAEEAEKLGVKCYRGSLNDVLGRLVGAMEYYDVDPVVQIDGDRAMQDVAVVDYLVETYFEEYPEYDCVVNLNKSGDYTFPPGQVVYVFKAAALFHANRLSLDDKAREHLYLAFFENRHLFRIRTIAAPKCWRRPDIRMAIDTPEDLEFNRRIFEKLYRKNTYFSVMDVFRLVDNNPELKNINNHITPQKMR